MFNIYFFFSNCSKKIVIHYVVNIRYSTRCNTSRMLLNVDTVRTGSSSMSLIHCTDTITRRARLFRISSQQGVNRCYRVGSSVSLVDWRDAGRGNRIGDAHRSYTCTLLGVRPIKRHLRPLETRRVHPFLASHSNCTHGPVAVNAHVCLANYFFLILW